MLRRVAAPVALAGIVVAVSAAPAIAEKRVRGGSLGAITVDDLRVPKGATRTLNGTRMKGTVEVPPLVMRPTPRR